MSTVASSGDSLEHQGLVAEAANKAVVVLPANIETTLTSKTMKAANAAMATTTSGRKSKCIINNLGNDSISVNELKEELQNTTSLGQLTTILNKTTTTLTAMDRFDAKEFPNLLSSLVDSIQFDKADEAGSEELDKTKKAQLEKRTKQFRRMKPPADGTAVAGKNKNLSVTTLTKYIKSLEAGNRDGCYQDFLYAIQHIQDTLKERADIINGFRDTIKSREAANSIGRCCNQAVTDENPTAPKLNFICNNNWTQDGSGGSICYPVVHENDDQCTVITHVTIGVNTKKCEFYLIQNMSKLVVCEKISDGEQAELMSEQRRLRVISLGKYGEMKTESPMETTLKAFVANNPASSILNMDNISEESKTSADLFFTFDVLENNHLIQVTPKYTSAENSEDCVFKIECNIQGIFDKICTLVDKRVDEIIKETVGTGAQVKPIVQADNGILALEASFACKLSPHVDISQVAKDLKVCKENEIYPFGNYTTPRSTKTNNSGETTTSKHGLGMLMAEDTLKSANLNSILNMEIRLKEFHALIENYTPQLPASKRRKMNSQGDDDTALPKRVRRASHSSASTSFFGNNATSSSTTTTKRGGSSKNEMAMDTINVNMKRRRHKSLMSFRTLSNASFSDEDISDVEAFKAEKEVAAESEEEEEEEEDEDMVMEESSRKRKRRVGGGDSYEKFFSNIIPTLDEDAADTVSVDIRNNLRMNYCPDIRNLLLKNDTDVSNNMFKILMRADMVGLGETAWGKPVASELYRKNLMKALYGKGSLMSLIKSFPDAFLVKLLDTMQLSALSPTNQSSLKKFITTVILSTFNKKHILVNGYGANLGANGSCSVPPSGKKLVENNCNPTGMKAISDIDFSNPLNYGELQREITQHSQEHVEKAEKLTNLLCKHLPTKNLSLCLKVALCRISGAYLDDMLNEIKRLIYIKDTDSIRIMAYTTLLKAGMPVFDNTAFRCMLIPRIFCASVLAEMGYNFTNDDWLDMSEDNPYGNFNFLEFAGKFNKKYDGDNYKRYFSTLAIQFVTAIASYLMYLTASCHSGNETVESFTRGNRAIAVDRLFNLSETEYERRLPLQMTKFSASSDFDFQICDSTKTCTKIFQSLEPPMVVTSAPTIFATMFSIHRGDTFDVLVASLNEFIKPKIISTNALVNPNMSKNHNSVFSPKMVGSTKKMSLDKLDQSKNNFYHSASKVQYLSIPLCRMVDVRFGLELSSKDNNKRNYKNLTNKKYEIVMASPFDPKTNTVNCITKHNGKVGHIQECNIYVREVGVGEETKTCLGKPTNGTEQEVDGTPLYLLGSCTSLEAMIQPFLSTTQRYSVDCNSFIRMIAVKPNVANSYCIPLSNSKSVTKHNYLNSHIKSAANQKDSSSTKSASAAQKDDSSSSSSSTKLASAATKAANAAPSQKLYVDYRKMVDSRLALFKTREKLIMTDNTVDYCTTANRKRIDKINKTLINLNNIVDNITSAERKKNEKLTKKAATITRKRATPTKKPPAAKNKTTATTTVKKPAAPKNPSAASTSTSRNNKRKRKEEGEETESVETPPPPPPPSDGEDEADEETVMTTTSTLNKNKENTKPKTSKRRNTTTLVAEPQTKKRKVNNTTPKTTSGRKKAREDDGATALEAELYKKSDVVLTTTNKKKATNKTTTATKKVAVASTPRPKKITATAPTQDMEDDTMDFETTTNRRSSSNTTKPIKVRKQKKLALGL